MQDWRGLLPALLARFWPRLLLITALDVSLVGLFLALPVGCLIEEVLLVEGEPRLQTTDKTRLELLKLSVYHVDAARLKAARDALPDLRGMCRTGADSVRAPSPGPSWSRPL